MTISQSKGFWSHRTDLSTVAQGRDAHYGFGINDNQLEWLTRSVHFTIARPSLGLAMIEVQNSAQSRASFDRSAGSVVVLGEQVRHHKFAADALMVPFAIVVLHKLTKQIPQMRFAEDHKPVLSANTSAGLSHDFANIGRLENAVRSGILDASHVARHAAVLRRDDCRRDDGSADANSGVHARGSSRPQRIA